MPYLVLNKNVPGHYVGKNFDLLVSVDVLKKANIISDSIEEGNVLTGIKPRPCIQMDSLHQENNERFHKRKMKKQNN